MADNLQQGSARLIAALIATGINPAGLSTFQDVDPPQAPGSPIYSDRVPVGDDHLLGAGLERDNDKDEHKICLFSNIISCFYNSSLLDRVVYGYVFKEKSMVRVQKKETDKGGEIFGKPMTPCTSYSQSITA